MPNLSRKGKDTSVKKYILVFLSGAITTWIACAAFGWKMIRKLNREEREASAWRQSVDVTADDE